MKTFILLTFAFLAFAGYQLSGGADFEPASVRMAGLQPAAEKAEVTAVQSVREAPQQDTVTRVSLNLTSVQPAIEAAREAPADVELRAPVEFVSANDNLIEAVPTNISTLSTENTPAIIPSLITPGDTRSNLAQIASAKDLREVTASRVNVRGGPGTEYGVVSKLARGDAVEVIEDAGNGWVRMRPLDGSPEGWMADFLLSSG